MINFADMRVARVRRAQLSSLTSPAAAKVMRANTGPHGDQARRHIGEPGLDLTARPALTQYDCASLIEADDVERILADIDANDRNRGIRLLGRAMSEFEGKAEYTLPSKYTRRDRNLPRGGSS